MCTNFPPFPFLLPTSPYPPVPTLLFHPIPHLPIHYLINLTTTRNQFNVKCCFSFLLVSNILLSTLFAKTINIPNTKLGNVFHLHSNDAQNII